MDSWYTVSALVPMISCFNPLLYAFASKNMCTQVCSMEQFNSSLVPFNISSTPGEPSPTSLVSIHLVPVVMLSICFLLGVPGNIAVIILKPNWQHLSSLSQSLMLNLAISDLICVLPLPLWIYTLLYSWTLGLVVCKLLTYFMFCSLYSSLLTVTLLSVQRYLQVMNLQNCLDRAGRRRLLVLLWLVTMILSIPALVIRQVIEDQHGTHCTDSHAPPSQLVAVLLSECLVGFFSISVVAFSYMGLHRKVNQAAFFNNPQTTRLITSIIVTFFVLWMPYYITNVLGVAALLQKKLRPLEVLLEKLERCFRTVCNMEQLNLTFNISSPPEIHLMPPGFLPSGPCSGAVHLLPAGSSWKYCCDHPQTKLAAPVQSESESDAEFGHIRPDLPAPPASVDLHFTVQWTLGLVACKILTYLMYCGVYSSMLTVTVLSVQRYLQVVNMQKIFECVGKRRLLVLLWLVTMILSIPALVVPQDTKDQYGTSCTHIDSLPSQLVAMLLTECLEGLVAISVVAFSYIGLHSKLNHAAFFNNPQTTRLIISLTVAFFLLWMSYHITNVLGVAAISLKNQGLWKFCLYSYNLVKSLHGTTEHLCDHLNISSTTRLITSIILTFFVLWMPYQARNVLGVAAILLKNEGLLTFCLYNLNPVTALVFFNSCLNPLIYAFASRTCALLTELPSLTRCPTLILSASNISSTPDHPSTASWVSIRLVPALVVSICFLLGVPGYIAVIILKPNWQHLSSLSQSLMLNLAISNLICLLPLPLWIYTLLYSWTLGLLLTYLMLCSLYSSLLSVTLLSVQRYLQVVNLQKMFDRVGKRRLLVLHWLVTMILSFPALVIRQVIKDQHGTDCTAVLLPECLIGFVSISVVAFSYIGVQRKVNQAAFFNNPQTTRLITSIIQVCSMEQLNTSAITFNISSTPGEPSNAPWVFYHLVPVVMLSICFLLGVPGNIAVIILKPNWQHLSSLSQSLMLNLAISDLICLLPCLCGFTPYCTAGL
ncbi:hypothetical protein F7725_019460 [Dissostichus mawsoni]|uniref:G-protein coupled receptors family 1 profile domain-containing protein n=1 Tax=Dissostichus mawsoni TaxID=36200 RepID=A0A7J5YL81_DISMA|nr:hypothetical protein F7725_019460 [Dissostichus mawsoni]